MYEVDELRDALEHEYPPSTSRVDDWDDVLARSRASVRRRRGRSPAIALAGAVAVVCVAVLLWPSGDSDSVLERARAVALADPVVHVVLGSNESPLTEIDLATGKSRRLEAHDEQWFDPDRGIHDVHFVDGRVLRDVLYPTGSSPEAERTLAALASSYRDALASGRASLAGDGEVDGRAVHWIRFHVRYPSFGLASYEADHEVAVDADTFKPVLWRKTEGSADLGIPTRTTEVKIQRWETLPAGTGDFTAVVNMAEVRDQSWHGIARLGPRSLEEARTVLAHRPLWLGAEFSGLPRTGMFELSAERGRQRTPRIEKRPALELCYGTRLNETSCEPPYPPGGDRYVQLTETEEPQEWLGWSQTVTPTEGTLIVNGGERVHAQGFGRRDGVYFVINASDEALLIEAARALEQMP